jgi:hypothetical protein
MWRLASSLLCASSLLSPPAAPAAVIESTELPPGEIVDLEVTSGGSLYILRADIPHMAILSPDGGLTELDLDRIAVPGGMCLVDEWGFFVSDALDGTIVRFDESGEVLDEFDAPGRPGDVVRDGLELWYLSRDEGAVRSPGDPGVVLFNLPSPESGSLSVSGGRFLLSGTGVAWIFGAGVPAVPVDTGGPAVITRYGVLVLDPGTGLVTSLAGDTLASCGGGEWDRIAASPGGGTIVLWRRSGPSALVIR